MMSSKQSTPPSESDLKTVLIAGVGNIGSGLTCMVARIEGVARILLVDPDAYQQKNLRCQDIGRCDVGKRKALVQARRLRRVNPAIDARALCARVEDLPLGALRCDVILSCLDSRLSRRYMNQAAWRLGVPWIDGAVDAAGLLARVNVYVPGPDATCMECGWDNDDYDTAALEQSYPCEKDAAGPAATNAPASLGLVTAGLMAIECQKLLAGDREHLLIGRQVMFDLQHHTHYVTTFQPKHCRFDHDMWQVEQLEDSPTRITLGQVVRLAGNGSSDSTGCAFRVEGQRFASMRFCPGCGHHGPIALRLAGRIPPALRRCEVCGQIMTVRGFDMREWLDSKALSSQDLARPLCTLGVEPGDVLSVRGVDGQRHFLLGSYATERAAGGRAAGRHSLSSNGARR